MALLKEETRKKYFLALGLGEYNKANIKKLQQKYMARKSDVDGIYGTNTDNLLRTLYNVARFTSNFKAEEFKCECGGRHCCGYPTYMKAVQLVHIQKIRDYYGKPMKVTCGMRCKGYNKELNGSVANSGHLKGLATDFFMEGVTDPLANRKKSIKWIKKQTHHDYTYGNGINSNGAYVSAPYMGNCLHTETSGSLTDAEKEKYGKTVKVPTSTDKSSTTADKSQIEVSAKVNYTVIDVSEFQTAIDWAKAKKDGVKGAIIRCGYRGAEKGTLQQDAMFLKHIKAAHKAGVKVGIYFFTEAITAEEGAEEAVYAVKLMKTAGVPISYPIGIDSENVWYKKNGKSYPGRANGISKAKRTAAIKGFCDKIKALGYDSMIYASTSWFSDKLDMSKLPYKVWCAQYASKCEYNGKNLVMWQYTSDGSVNGYKGRLDMNHCYIEPKEIFTPPTEVVVEKKGYDGEFPNTSVKYSYDRGKDIQAKAKEYAYSYGTDPDKYSYKKGEPKASYKKALKEYYGKTAKVSQSDCGYFVGTCVRAAGVSKNFLALPGKGSDPYPSVPSTMKIVHEGKSIPDRLLQAGDIIRYRKKSGGQHTLMCYSNGKIAEAGRENQFPAIEKDTKKYNGSNVKKGSIQVLRAKTTTKTRSYLMKGDSGDEVKKLQKYLNWYGNYGLTVDGKFGDKTLEAVKAFQKNNGLDADGMVGAKTVEKMKGVVK